MARRTDKPYPFQTVVGRTKAGRPVVGTLGGGIRGNKAQVLVATTRGIRPVGIPARGLRVATAAESKAERRSSQVNARRANVVRRRTFGRAATMASARGARTTKMGTRGTAAGKQARRVATSRRATARIRASRVFTPRLHPRGANGRFVRK